jgi:site-specific DNA-methyltransferase (adenine-specific)
MKNISINAECENILNNMQDNCVDTIITDPPYGLKFKSHKWDYNLPSVGVFKELLRIIKPGGQMLIFGGTRTFHRLAVNIEDAGWNINDTICWLYGSGFPKSVDIAYMIDKNRDEKGKIIQSMEVGGIMDKNKKKEIMNVYEPVLDEAKKWNGWGTALKPAWEPILVCSKSIEGNYDDNAINNGVVGFWIDGVRIKNNKNIHYGIKRTSTGRWPSNVIMDSISKSILEKQRKNASRFFYCPKAKKEEYNIHDTVKPLDLIVYLCNLTRTPTGGVVLDPYSGSGTTAVACIETDRNYIIIEKEKKYYDVGVKRINENI